MLKEVTKCRNVVVWGRDAKKMDLYKKDVEKMGFKVTCAKDASQVGASCNLIVTATCATSPVLMSEHVKAGTHITAVGADGVGKHEVDHKVLGRAQLVVADSLTTTWVNYQLSQIIQSKPAHPNSAFQTNIFPT